MPEARLNSERDLVRVVQAASAVSLGTLAGLLYSVKRVSPSIEFRFSFATVLAFLLAAFGSMAFWQVVFALNKSEVNPMSAGGVQSQRIRKFWLALLAGVLAGSLVLAFWLPLRDFSQDKQSEISFGALVALAFLGVLALLFWRVVRYLESSK